VQGDTSSRQQPPNNCPDTDTYRATVADTDTNNREGAKNVAGNAGLLIICAECGGDDIEYFA